jgi:hypothetical protein
MYRRAILRNSGYTRSASRAKAAWSPLFQALSSSVIPSDRALMDGPPPVGTKKLSQTWPLSPLSSARTGGRRTGFQNDLLPLDRRQTMKHIATVALMLNLGAPQASTHNNDP